MEFHLTESFNPDAFLRDYWQKKPLLIRNPWREWANPLEPEELAGLACEEGVEARLVTQGCEGWAVEQAPIAEERFGELGRERWTLLVQAVEQHVPDVADLIEPFRFIPDWRIDDVMVSYAADGGGVGPHFDQYDVFLVQGLGKRRWRIGGRCDDSSALVPDSPLRQLAEFEMREGWVLEPGDILYLPPGIAHDGVAVGEDCMTYSVGFRAPARAELADAWGDEPGEADDRDRFEDPDLVRQINPGEISAAALDRLFAMAGDAGDRAEFVRWFGEYNTRSKYPEVDWRPEEEVSADDVRAMLTAEVPVRRNPASRFAFVREGEGVLLFADGVGSECSGESAAFAEQLCAHRRIAFDPRLEKEEAVVELLTELINQGCLAFDPVD